MEGIFRVSGSVLQIRAIKDAINQGISNINKIQIYKLKRQKEREREKEI